MTWLLLTFHGLSLLVYAFVVWRFARVHRSESRLLDELQEEGSVPARSRPVLFAVSYGIMTLAVVVSTSLLFAFQPHWL